MRAGNHHSETESMGEGFARSKPIPCLKKAASLAAGGVTTKRWFYGDLEKSVLRATCVACRLLEGEGVKDGVFVNGNVFVAADRVRRQTDRFLVSASVALAHAVGV